MTPETKDFLAGLFHEAVHAAAPLAALRPHLPPRPKGRTVVVGAGKGAAQMAAAFESGADRVVIGTAFEQNPKILRQILNDEHIH